MPQVKPARGKRLHRAVTCAMLRTVRNVASIWAKVHRTKPSPRSRPVTALGPRLLMAASLLAAAVTIQSSGQARRGESRCRLDEPMVLTASPQETITALAFSPNGKLLTAGTDQGRVLVWALPSGSKEFEAVGPRRVEALVFSPDGKLLAAATSNPGLRLWRMGSKLTEVLFTAPARDVTALAFSPDGSLLAFGGRNRTVGFYRLQDGKPPLRMDKRLTGPTSWISALAFSPDGKVVYCGAWDDRVRAFELVSGRQIWESHVHRFSIEAILPTPAGLAVSADDGRLTFHRPTDGRVTRQYRPGALVDMAKTGSLLGGITWEGKLLFLDATRARIRCAPRVEKGRRKSTWSLALSRTRVAVGDNRGRVLVFSLPPPAPDSLTEFVVRALGGAGIADDTLEQRAVKRYPPRIACPAVIETGITTVGTPLQTLGEIHAIRVALAGCQLLGAGLPLGTNLTGAAIGRGRIAGSVPTTAATHIQRALRITREHTAIESQGLAGVASQVLPIAVLEPRGHAIPAVRGHRYAMAPIQPTV